MMRGRILSICTSWNALPGYPFLCRIPFEERSLKYSYDLIELPISGDRGSYADFYMEINVFYFNQDMERQSVKFFDAHTFLALYNHSFFVRMHVHNVWVLRHTKIDIVLPELFFETQDHVFLFCGTMEIRGICDDFEITNFDFVNLLFAASYRIRSVSTLMQMWYSKGPYRLQRAWMSAIRHVPQHQLCLQTVYPFTLHYNLYHYLQAVGK